MEVQWYLHQLQHKLQRLRLVQQYHEKRISHRLDCHTGEGIEPFCDFKIQIQTRSVMTNVYFSFSFSRIIFQQRTTYVGWQCKPCFKRHKSIDTNDGHNANILTNATNAG